jgi:hypothetical protein
MSATELGEWLETEESRAVGWHREGENEAIGNQSGRRIVENCAGQKQISKATMHAWAKWLGI